MFDSLGKGLSGLIRKLTTGTSVDKKLVEEILNDLKILLLQSDVDIKLADELVSNVRRKTLEEKTPAGLTLREHVLKTIYEELVKLLGENPAPLMGKKRIMFVGLFGSGKTTTIGKLSKSLMKQGLKPALVALDYHRPAAPQQLEQLGKQIGVPVHINSNKNPYEAAAEGMKKFEKYDTVIFDTAGRNALDKELAEELKKLTEIIKPDEVLLVIPADLGKVAKVQAEEFHKLAGVTGVVISKMDGTAKAGGALAAASVTGAKVKFIGVGEKIDDLESYDPKRFVSRLLGLGDLETLLEKAKEVDIKKESVEKIVEGRFNLQDFYDQIEAMQKMGPLGQIAKMVPGLGAAMPEAMMEKQEEKMKRFKHILQSMTKSEKENPGIVNASRIKRIAKGSGRPESEVRELLDQYEKMKKMMKMLGGQAGLQRGALKNLGKQFGFKF
ncbi:MAG: signal recognition particle receptor subunit alpha [Candidatus Aenigmarchaeota archaeon]|nr:signal recognition particle receptor subunit alpha [Candidatus Aenigmarchaeota archaeon]